MRGSDRSVPVFLATIFLLALVSCDAPDKKWVSDTTGVSFLIPGDHGWNVQPPAGVSKISLRGKSGLVSYSEMPQKGPVTLTQKAGEAWESRYLKASLGTKLSGQTITFHGRPAYEFEEQHSDPESGVQSRTKGILCSTGNTLFSILATKAARDNPGDPLQDPAIKKFVDSIQIPESPQSASASH
jgi:hypothetical protein